MVIDIGVIFLKRNSIPLPDTYSEIFSNLNKSGFMSLSLSDSIKKAVSFRNIAVHEYSKLQLERVYQLSQKEIQDLKRFGNWALESLKSP